MALIDRIEKSFKNGSAVTRLIYINVGVYILMLIIQLGVTIFNLNIDSNNFTSILDFKEVLSMPASFSTFIANPWVCISYMFIHDGFFHLLFNMLWFVWFGFMFQNLYSQRHLVSLYILGGLGGAALFMLLYNFLPYFKPLVDVTTMVGASASIMAIVVAAATARPNDIIPLIFIGQVKLKHIVLFYIFIDIIMIGGDNSGGHMSHIGGAITGFLYVKALQSKSINLTSRVNRFFDFFTSIFKGKKSKMKMKYHRPSKTGLSHASDYMYNEKKAEDQNRVNEILDKIKLYGYDSLTKEEKKFLFDLKN